MSFTTILGGVGVVVLIAVVVRGLTVRREPATDQVGSNGKNDVDPPKED